MSFSQNIKNEIFESLNNNKCCKQSMRYGELVSENDLKEDNSSTENINKKTCCKKAYIKGVFLGSGCIVNPEIDYHFEVNLKSKKAAEYTKTILKDFDIHPKILKRAAKQYTLYLKDSEQISTILRILEANKSMLEYENIRVTKSIRNGINRNINCETANMTKIFETAMIQIYAIDKIIDAKEYNNLTSALKEICVLRKKYPEASLQELANKCNPILTKSGVNHRLNKIMKLAGKL